MILIKMKSPEKSGGFSVGNHSYTPDGDGIVMVNIDHAETARSHGFRPMSFMADAHASPVVDPNVQRPGGASQHHVSPGNAPTPVVELTQTEKDSVLADETARAGRLLDETEKQSLLAGALAAKRKHIYDQMGLELGEEPTQIGEDDAERAAALQTPKENTKGNPVGKAGGK